MVMKKILSSLLIAACAASTASAVNYSGKTFFMPRAVGDNLAMRHSGALRHAQGERGGAKPGSSAVSVTGLFQRSVNAEAMGRYFGVGNGLNSFRVGYRADPAGAIQDASVEVNGHSLIHDLRNIAVIAKVPSGVISFKPTVESYGVSLGFVKNLGGKFEHCFFAASTSLLHMNHDLRMDIAQDAKQTIWGKSFTLKDFFAGKVQIEGNEGGNSLRDKQNPLQALKIHGRRSVAGIADLDLSFGCRYPSSKNKHAAIATHITIPTGTRAKGEYLFEPVCGNGQHVGLGASIDAGVLMWKGASAECNLRLAARYDYLFEATQVRYPSIKKSVYKDGFGKGMLHYYLAARKVAVNNGGHVADVTFEPLANLMPNHARVKPGSKIDSNVGVNFSNKNFVVDVSYGLCWRDKESVWMKDKFVGEVGIVNINAAAIGNFTNNRLFIEQHMLTDNDLDISSITVPTQLSHKISSAFSYKQNLDTHQILWSLGGSYEFVQDNAALEQYTFWAGMNIDF